ncbi:MSCRAMM family protein [Agromyces sp. SYSU T00194]|uniref:MSCRAMM family protein n=1 Tax=Agromyces chitinivorans TaxID=3158560 RepID=UPI0033939163
MSRYESTPRRVPPDGARRRRMRRLTAVGAGIALVGAAFVAGPAFATHGLVSLTGSDFEIDEDANLKVDDGGDWTDWVTFPHALPSDPEKRKADLPSGSGDDSFGQGSKEDTEVPSVVDGSIPPNKSDLKTFGTYLEETDGGDFLHMFWHRVQDPTGTTNMDFEFNQSDELSDNGVTPVRTEDDMLIQYDLSNGGTHPELFLSKWVETGPKALCEAANSTPCWGVRVNLTDADDATGSINTSAIPAAESDGLGNVSPRTFGEATVDFSAIVGDDECVSFGSAYLKSRSSDSFPSALKDFIAPLDVDLTNCAKVIIRKVTDPTGDSTEFDFTTAFETQDDGTNPTFSLGDGESVTYDNVFFGNGLTVTESGPPSGWDLVDIDCSASTNISPTEDEASQTATFNLTDSDQIVDCTFTNQARGTIVVEKVTTDGYGPFDFTSSTLPDASFTLTTTQAGAAGKDSNTYASLTPGTYDVAETVPANWNLDSATCDDGSDPASIGLSAGETVTCTFVNELERGSIKIVKTRKHAAATVPNADPHEGVTFTVSGGDLTTPIEVQTDANGVACVTGLVVSAVAGNYTVTETVPSGYELDPTTPSPQTAAVGEATATDCSDTSPGAVKSFHNIPLTNLTVSVDSQVDGGTYSSIECDATVEDPDSDPDIPLSAKQDDPSVTIEDLLPGTYTCVVVIDP